MRINVLPLAVTLGFFWGAAIAIVAATNLVWPSYGRPFLELVASVYPGYHALRSPGQVVVGGVYGLVDGGLCGWLLALIYNFLSASPAARA